MTIVDGLTLSGGNIHQKEYNLWFESSWSFATLRYYINFTSNGKDWARYKNRDGVVQVRMLESLMQRGQWKSIIWVRILFLGLGSVIASTYSTLISNIYKRLQINIILTLILRIGYRFESHPVFFRLCVKKSWNIF